MDVLIVDVLIDLRRLFAEWLVSTLFDYYVWSMTLILAEGELLRFIKTLYMHIINILFFKLVLYIYVWKTLNLSILTSCKLYLLNLLIVLILLLYIDFKICFVFVIRYVMGTLYRTFRDSYCKLETNICIRELFVLHLLYPFWWNCLSRILDETECTIVSVD